MLEKIKSLHTKDVTSFLVRRFSSFAYLNVTQFLGALNDNIFKLLIVYFFIQIEGIENSPRILSLAGAVFVLPFLLFSASSGVLADRFSKRNIIVLTKLFELVIMIGGLIAFSLESKIGSFFILFLLATQSAIFGPSKYGILPELVEENKIPKANGVMTSFTFLAIIIGTFAASFVLDITARNFILATAFCTFLSVIGLATSFCIEYTPPSGSHNRFNILFISQIYKALKKAYTVPSLLAAIFGSSFFLLLGAYAQLNLIPYAVHSLHLTDIQGGYLFLLTALGIGVGSMIAGKISGSTVELGLIPIMTICITICCFMLDFLSDNIAIVLPLIFLFGVFGGIYQVPIDSYIQVASPKESRGQIVAATNFLSFLGVLIASSLLYLTSDVFGFAADKGFTVMGCITILVSILSMFQFFDYMCRFVGMILSKLHFRTIINGTENIPANPTIYICTHTAWNDMLLMLGSQRRRIRFFVEQEQDHSKWMKKIYQVLRVVNIPSVEPLEKNNACIEEIKMTLRRGMSVCIFVDNTDICAELEKLYESYSIQEILKDTGATLTPVSIEKGEREIDAKRFKKLREKLNVPAEISFGNLVCDVEDASVEIS